ncbi:DMT family transporter [Pseudoalteromonas peptidolytica]|nr:EamA family transporter [Pseudoalteromonas peptidolytica]GEK10108.1 multidrug transporter [Pseudoalteromonas peptidolytica]
MNILLAMIPAFLWGTTYAVTQYTLADWPPLLLGAIRALPAGLILLAIKPSTPKKEDWPILFGLGAINIAIFFGMIFIMALTLPSAISSVGMVSVPVFAMFYHWLVHKQRPGLAQGLCGAALIFLAWLLFDPSSLSLNPLGLGAMLAAITCIVIGSAITKSLGGRMPWWTVLTWQLIIGGTMLTLAAAFQGIIAPTSYIAAFDSFSVVNFVGIVWVVVLNTALGYSLYVWALQRMSVVEFAFGGIANPLAGILTGMILLGEAFSLFQYMLMFGMIMMPLLPALLTARVRGKALTAS